MSDKSTAWGTSGVVELSQNLKDSPIHSLRGEYTLTSGGGAIWGCWCCWHAGTSKLLQVHVQPGRMEFVERRHHPRYNTKPKLKSRGMEERDIPPPAIIPSRNGRRCGRGRDGKDGGLSPRTTDQHQKTTGLASS